MKSRGKLPVIKPSGKNHTREPLIEKDEVKEAEKRTQGKPAEKDVEAELKIRGLK